MNIGSVNIFPVLVAAVSSFLLGGLWYSNAIFGKVWAREANVSQESHSPQVFVISLVFSLIAAYVFSWWLGPNPDLTFAVVQGLLVGGCFVAASFGINYQFAARSHLLWLIDGGYHTAQFALFGLVLGLWP